MIDPRRSGVGGGDVVRDCAVVEYVLLLPSLHLSSSSSLDISVLSYFTTHIPSYKPTISHYG